MWKFHIYADAGGGYRWRLKAANGRIVADSGEAYSSRSAARQAVERDRGHIGRAAVVED